MNEPQIVTCPRCHEENADNWPVSATSDGENIQYGGCQSCWEDDCAVAWWDYQATNDVMELFTIFA